MVYAALATLSPAAFVQLSEEDNGGTESTAEGRMLEASRDEIRKKVADDVHGFKRLRDSIVLCLDLYIWEPICTGLRFLHLFVIFVPVIISVPAIWIGRRNQKKDNERPGTLWWYRFLVRSMERAGPAFIKVRLGTNDNWLNHTDDYSWDNGPLLDRIYFPLKCARLCPNFIPTHRLIPFIPQNE